MEGRGPQDEEFTEIQIQEVTVDEESALLVVGGFTTNHDISEGTEEGMDLRLRHTWEEEDSALSMSRGEPWLEMKRSSRPLRMSSLRTKKSHLDRLKTGKNLSKTERS